MTQNKIKVGDLVKINYIFSSFGIVLETKDTRCEVYWFFIGENKSAVWPEFEIELDKIA